MARQRDVEIEDDEDDVTEKTRDLALGTTDEADDLDFEPAPAAGERARAGGDEELDQETDRRLAYDEEEDGDGPSERGTSRRARRNRARRDARDQSLAVIAAQEQRIRALEGHLGELNRSQLGLAAGDIDGQIATVQNHLEQIDGAFASAVSDQDQVKIRRAMRLRDEANLRLNALANERRRLEMIAAQHGQPQQQNQQQQEQRGMVDVDPDAERYSEIFMDRHPWFDPKDNSHEDSQLVKAIDDTLVRQGFKPNTSRYWKELERRVEARGLGTESEDRVDDRDDDYERPARGATRRESEDRSSSRRSGGLPPRGRRGGGGGRPGGEGERTLPALARDTLDQLGLLDKKGLNEDQLKEREGYIRQWRTGLKEAAKNEGRRGGRE